MSEADRSTSLPFSKEIRCISSMLDKPAKCVRTNFLETQYYQTDFSTAIPVDVSVYPAEKLESGRWSAFSNWMESENETASLTPTEVATLVDLIQEMRLSNNNLLERVIQLEQALAESQDGWQSYKQRSQVAETMLVQKTQDLTSAQEQIQFLSHELKTAHHTAQYQQNLIENLTTQLAVGQERMAQMERECALTQANYNEKFHQLIQSETSGRELRTRLIRQQRYTMQLKFALEKCLEIPNHSSQFQSDEYSGWNSTIDEQTIFSQQAHALFPKAQPISPWSAQMSSYTAELEFTWTESSGIGSRQSDVDIAEEPGWQDLFNFNWTEAEEEEIADAEEDLLAAKFAFSVDIAHQNQNLLNQTNQFQSSEPLPNTRASRANANWPSPLVHPLHPPKGRKSLSAIELPTFTK